MVHLRVGPANQPPSLLTRFVLCCFFSCCAWPSLIVGPACRCCGVRVCMPFRLLISVTAWVGSISFMSSSLTIRFFRRFYTRRCGREKGEASEEKKGGRVPAPSGSGGRSSGQRPHLQDPGVDAHGKHSLCLLFPGPTSAWTAGPSPPVPALLFLARILHAAVPPL